MPAALIATLVTIFALFAPGASASDELPMEKVWETKGKFTGAPAPTAFDLDLDGDWELLVASGDGKAVALLDSETGKPLWETSVALRGTLGRAALAGHFWGDSTLDLALISSGGTLVLLDGLTGALLSAFESGTSPIVDPTLFPVAEAGDAPAREGITLLDNEGNVTVYVFDPGGLPQVLSQHWLRGPSDAELIIGHTSSAQPAPHIVGLNGQGWLTISSTVDYEAEPEAFRLPRRLYLRSHLILGDVTGDGTDEILVADQSGWLHAYRVAGSNLKRVWPKVSIRSKPAFGPALIDVDQDGSQDILIPKSNSYLLINGATGKGDLWPAKENQYLHDVSIASPPAVFRGGDGVAYVAFSDASGRITILDLVQKKIKTSAGGTQYKIGLKAANAVRTSLLVGPLRGSGRTEIFSLGSRSGEGCLVSLELSWNPEEPVWTGIGGGWRRAGGLKPWDLEYANQRETKFRLLCAEKVTAAREQLEQRNWDEAISFAQAALRIVPGDEEASEILNSAENHANLFSRILMGIFLLAVLGGAGAVGGIYALRQARLSMARKARIGGDIDSAIGAYTALLKAAPGNQSYLKEFADVLVESGRTGPDSIAVLESARKSFPNQPEYLEALANVYLAERRRDETAARIFGEMTSAEPRRGEWLFALGQTYHEMGKMEEARSCCEKAESLGLRNPELDSTLARLYVELKVDDPKVLPKLISDLDRHQHDPDFLALLCKACRSAEGLDPSDQASVQKAAKWLAELQPDNPDANSILLRGAAASGERRETAAYAEALLRAEPENQDAIEILARFYASEARTDGASRAIYERALQSKPDLGDVLIALSHTYIEEGREDKNSEALYRRVLTDGTGDQMILEYLLKMADSRQDDDLRILALEALRNSGKADAKRAVQLARAYCRKDVVKPEAKAVFEEALAAQPGDELIERNLARIYAAEGRLDDGSRALFESVHARPQAPQDVSAQLVLAYEAKGETDRAATLADDLLAKHPEDPSVIKAAARTAMAQENFEDAQARFEKVLKNDPEDGDAIVGLAEIYQESHRTDDDASAVYEKAMAHRPKDIDLHAALARCQVTRGQWEEVVATVQHFLRRAPKRMADAIGLMDELIEPRPEAIKLHWFLAENLIYRNELHRATEVLHQITRIDPAEQDKALEAYDKILARDPKQPDAHHRRGLIKLRQGKVAEARQELEQAFRSDQENEVIGRDLAKLYEKVLEQRESMTVRFQLGKVALKAKKFDLAISCFQKTEKDNRFKAESIRYLARCFILKGMLDLAFQQVRRLKMDESIMMLLYKLGQSYEIVRDPKGALEAYKLIYAADIGFQDVKERIDQLHEAPSKISSHQRSEILGALSDRAKSRYDLMQELGRGAMGIVYKARDKELEEIVALKILPDTLEKNKNALKLFRQEARNARRLAHQNIVRIHDIGEDRGRKYISMEFIDGFDLKQRLKQLKDRLPLDETLSYARQISSAMIAAHEASIVHRDLKPANIMIAKNGTVKVTDFGIAKMIADEPQMYRSKPGAVVGTPLYMSPEQVMGENVDHRADIYSFGVLLYEMLSGKPPFYEGNLAQHHLNTEPPPLPHDVPEPLQRVTLKCLAKKPSDRVQTAKDLSELLAAIEI